MPITVRSRSLQEDCVRSCGIYLNYLDENRGTGKGLLRARVRGIQRSLLDGSLLLLTDREIRSGDGMMLRIGDEVWENTDDGPSFVVESADRRRIVLTPSAELSERLARAESEGEKVFAEIDLTFLARRVKDWFEKHGAEMEFPSARPRCRLAPDNPVMLSDNQYDCAGTAMSRPLSYIWGAPGTGKTKHVLASCVYSYIQAGRKVILAAPTNNALEQSLQGLLRALSDAGINPDGRVLRMGYPSEGFREAWPNICESGAFRYLKAETDGEISRLKYENSLMEESLLFRAGKAGEDAEDRFPELSARELKTLRKKNLERLGELQGQDGGAAEGRNPPSLISRFSVIACTVDACISRLPPGGSFRPDHVFLDEAGYCSLIKGLTLTGFGCPLTMLGDHRQLPPVFDCDDRRLLGDPEMRVIRLWQISTLYLEYAFSDEDRNRLYLREPDRPVFSRTAAAALTETYRFGPALTRILAGRVYGKDFRSLSGNATRILYVNAPKREEDKGQDASGEYRRVSASEGACIREMLEYNLFGRGYSVGIITPYAKQRNQLASALHRMLKKAGLEEDLEDDVVTVHRSQGREWDVVLFSVTDSFDEKWYTNSARPEALKLLNTAVSRARKLLILVGDAPDWMMRGGQLLSDLFRAAEEVPPQTRFDRFLIG